MEPPPTPTRRPLPKYTSIDLESELPEIFSTNLNPQLRDPDMSSFYSHPNLGRYNYPHPKGQGNRVSPPPIYERPTGWTPPDSPGGPLKITKTSITPHRTRVFWISFVIVFFVIPLIILFVFGLLPHLLDVGQFRSGREFRE